MVAPGSLPPVSALPAELRDAIADGWQGLTLLTDGPPEEPVTLVCAAPACRLRCVDACAFTVGRGEDGPDSAGSRLLVVALEERAEAERPSAEARLSVGIDLAYREARELVERACAQGALRIAWVAVDAGAPEPRHERVTLRAGQRAHLRAAVARAGEWHAAVPVPLGVEAGEWRAARRLPPRLVRGSFAEGPVALVVPAPALLGAEGERGQVSFALPNGAHAHRDEGEAAREPALLLRFTREGAPPHSAPPVTLVLADPAQRELAEALADQRQVIVMGVAGHQLGPLAHVRAALSPGARALIRLAAAGSRRA